jgi:hypothetical protein
MPSIKSRRCIGTQNYHQNDLGMHINHSNQKTYGNSSKIQIQAGQSYLNILNLNNYHHQNQNIKDIKLIEQEDDVNYRKSKRPTSALRKNMTVN